MATHLAPDASTTVGGITVQAVGMHVDLDVETLEAAGSPGLAGRLVRAGTPHAAALRVAAAADRLGMRADLALPVTTDDHRPGAETVLRLDAVVPPPGEGQVVLQADPDGVLAWHLPASEAPVFAVPLRSDRPAATTLLVLRFALPDLAGGVATRLVSAWEATARPSVVRPVDPSGVTDEPLTTEQWQRLGAGPVLVLLHGTFSTAGATFADLFGDGAPAADLLRAYEGRVVAFDHPSVTPDPFENAARLLAEVPGDVRLVLDVVSHSRGGLVGRALPVLDDGRVTVRRHLHVATPNAGTVLADPDRWVTLLGVLTTLLSGEDAEGDGGALPAVVATVAQLATGVLDGLDGLAALQPGSAVLERLRRAGEDGLRASAQATVSADVEPGPGVGGALDQLVDVFFGEPNDLVVPTAGTARLPGLSPADATVLPDMPLVTHTGYFRDERVRRLLVTELDEG